ncbi:MarR family winged helix-turn-helix transcriptional regulator [Nocardioides insulae]|uniref:MarR family winged helix-turn-helix transcriptional regulator n=1 Tax=Nocardioides insulae TaxID=394734 RepID=UPI000426AE1C|nr:MarR family transcriptional regulator [Nocardioides insulae]
MTPAEPVGEPLVRHTGHLLRRAQQVHTAVWQRDVSTQVTSVQYAVLSVLRARPGASQAELGAELVLDRSTVADLVVRMTGRGLIAREQDPTDRRRKVLTLTADGRAKLADLRPKVDGLEPVLTAGLTDDDAVEFRRMLQTILDAAGESELVD